MKNFYRLLLACALSALIAIPNTDLYAGNKDRSGQAGAPELLINPWARATGWGSVNTANARGLEATFANVAGLCFTNGTEVSFSHTQWLKGSDVSINSFGLAQRLGESNVLGISIQSMSFGKLKVTTVAQPEGTGAEFSPNLLTIGISFAKAFSNSIFAGITVKIISESIPDASAMGIAIDAGVTYITGPQDNVKFGVSLRNLGPKMKFTGDGFSIKALLSDDDYSITMNQRSEGFELPTQLRIGIAYDLLLGEASRLTFAGNFVSNSFTKDQFVVGMEFSLKEYLMLRAGYTYEGNGTESIESTTTNRTNVYNGPSVGISVKVPFNKEKKSGLAIDYSYQTTAHFKGTHVIGVSLQL